MKFTVLAVDKFRNKSYRRLAREYEKRIDRHGSVKTTEVRRSSANSPAECSKEESSALLDRVKRSTTLICVDERGTHYTSPGLAKTMEEDMIRGRSHWTLLIGGANGHADIARSRAQRVWSLSKMVLPHEMARVLVLEQLYRALSIIHNEPYHRG